MKKLFPWGVDVDPRMERYKLCGRQDCLYMHRGFQLIPDLSEPEQDFFGDISIRPRTSLGWIAVEQTLGRGNSYKCEKGDYIATVRRGADGRMMVDLELKGDFGPDDSGYLFALYCE